MKHKRTMATLLTVMIAGTGLLAVATNAEQSASPPAGMPKMGQMHMGQMHKGGGMMGGDMMGMMDMMGSCNRMMGNGMMSGAAMLRLPPGNEKLQLQMQAEMMQKMGEIVAKYAARIKDEK